jgi:peptide/nickel transport system substrate-binding protein
MGKTIAGCALAALATLVCLLSPVGPARAGQGQLVISVPAEPPHLDPSSSPTDSTAAVVHINLFEGLTRIDQHGVAQPCLAERWHVSGDGQTYTFYLRRNVRFHDGSPFNADVAAFSLRRIIAEGSANSQRSQFLHLDRIEPVADNILRLTLSHPDAGLLFKLGQGGAAMVSPGTVSTNHLQPNGTGPFAFVRWTPGKQLELRRFDGYWGRPAGMALVIFRFISNPLAALSDLNIGDINAATRLPLQLDLRGFADSGQFRISSVATEGEVVIDVNHSRKPFNDLRVRQALSHAINRAPLTEDPETRLGPAIGSHLPPHHPAYIDLTGRYPHDPAMARTLLAEAGYPDGITARLALPPFWYARIAGLVLANQLQAAGFTVETEELDWREWLDRVYRRHDFDLTIIAHTEPNDISLYARRDYYTSYRNPAFDALVERIERTVDLGQQYVLLQEAQRMLANDAAAVFLFQLTLRNAYDRRLEGLWESLPIEVTDVTAARWKEP